jgi:hypothetical protein
MPLMVDRMTRTASLSTSHSSPGLPPHHRQGARCCLRLFWRRLSVRRNCTCMLTVMVVMVDRIMRTALLSASHSSPGLPARQRPRQRARCCLRLFCRRLSVVCRNCTCMRVWLMAVMVDRVTRTASLSASHSSPGLPAHHRQGARCCLRLFCRRLSVVCRNCTCMLNMVDACDGG